MRQILAAAPLVPCPRGLVIQAQPWVPQVRGPRGQVFVRGVEISILRPGRALNRQVAAFVVLLVALALTAAAQQPLVGHPAPALARPDLDARPVDLAALRGRVVLVNFWASWCGPCLVEMPRFAQWRRDHPADLAVIGVSMDDDAETANRARQKLAVDYPIVMADAPLATAWGGVLGLPVTFLVDRQGQVRYCFQGETDLNGIESRIRELMAAP